MSPPPLSHFPDLCLLAIFKYLCLSDLIRHIGLVCPKWARVQLDELKRRHSLVIIQTDNQIYQLQSNPFGSDLIEKVLRDDESPLAVLPHQNNDFNALRLPSKALPSNSDCMGKHKLTEAFTSGVIDFLPNITHLTIFQRNVSVLVSAQIVPLIKQYAAKLVSLKIEFLPTWVGLSIETNDKAQASMHALFDSINRIVSLRHLTLSVNFTGLDTQTSLSILSRLTTFTVHYIEPSSLLIASLREYASTGDVRVECLRHFKLTELVQFDLQMATRFTCASIDNVTVTDYDNTRRFCTRFSSLTTLKLSISMPMTMLARCLSLLLHLISLNLNYGPIPGEEQTPQLPIAQVPSVRLLSLTIRPESHHDTKRLHLHQIFPNLQVLHLTHYGIECSECEYNLLFRFPRNVLELAARIAHCMSLARQPFRNCVTLHTIKLETSSELQQFVLLPQGLLTVDQL